jgi:hypothetical protein
MRGRFVLAILMGTTGTTIADSAPVLVILGRGKLSPIIVGAKSTLQWVQPEVPLYPPPVILAPQGGGFRQAAAGSFSTA